MLFEQDEEMDYNIDNYNINELLLVYGFDTTPTSNEIQRKTNELVEKFEKEENLEMVTFFNEANKKMLDYLRGIKGDDMYRDVSSDEGGRE